MQAGMILSLFSSSSLLLRPTSLLLFFLLAATTTTNAIPLLGGRFETISDVQAYLNLAYDASDMREAETLEAKTAIYENGTGGQPAAVTFSSLSVTAAETMIDSPLFNMFRHAFLVLGNANEGEAIGTFDGNPIEQYADTLVHDLFKLDLDNNIETDAALVMNLWMAVAHQLFNVMKSCHDNQATAALQALDKAAAMWIGAEQIEGSNEDGHLLYNLAEKAGVRFDQDNGETQVNTKVVDLMALMQNDLQTSQCASLNGYLTMRENVSKMIGLISIPLIQNLFHHIVNLDSGGGAQFVELYSLSVLPRVAACNPVVYDEDLKLTVLTTLQSTDSLRTISAIQDSFSCLGITCADVGSYEGGQIPACQDPNDVTVAGYTSGRVAAALKSDMDRDLLQIDIFLKFKAYDAAIDWYENGWNSAFSLADLAKNEVIPSASDGSMFATFQTYYDNNPSFAHNLILNMMELKAPYDQATSDQLRNLVTGALKYNVVFPSSVSALQYSMDQCDQGNSEAALSTLDTGVMFYVGSMEGPLPNGNEFGGEFLFTDAQDFCNDFGTCSGSGIANSNTVVMNGFRSLAQLVANGSCAAAKTSLTDEIIPAMLIPLVQGTLKYASYNEGLPTGSEDSALAIGDSYARGILPLLNQASDATLASTVESNMLFQMSSKPVATGYESVADAFRVGLSAFGTDCNDVGILVDEEDEGNLCGAAPTGVAPTTPAQSGTTPTGTSPTPAPVQAPKPTSSANVAWGRYKFSSNEVAKMDAAFSLDVRDMFNAPTIDAATSIYTNGANAQTHGLSGQVGLVSLASLSLEAAEYMSVDPTFNIYRYGLYDDADLEDVSGSDFTYANDVIEKALNQGGDQKLAAEGTVVLNIFMLIAHRLHSAVRLCKSGTSPLEILDSAVALWIGEDQVEAKFDHGWMLYSIGQESAKEYGHSEKEAKVNTELMKLFNSMQKVAGTCVDSASAYVELRMKALETIRTLTKSLTLAMLLHMAMDSKFMTELYAVAVIPQAYACNPDAGQALESHLYSGYDFATSLTDDVYNHLANFLRCQRITCPDIGVTDKVAVPALKTMVNKLCLNLHSYEDTSDFPPMSGYVPVTDVREDARLDLDTNEIEIYMRGRAYAAALDVYQLGSNAYDESKAGFISLQSIATSDLRSPVLEYQEISSYYGNENYADSTILDAMNVRGAYASASRGQRSEVVFRTIQTMVAYAAVAYKMQAAVDNCIAKETERAQYYWDSAVALFVGSMEGAAAGGSLEGDAEFLYALGNEVCIDFGTCGGSGESVINEKVLFLFAGGRDALADGECSFLKRTMTFDIMPKLAVPIAQALLTYADDLEDEEVTQVDTLATVNVFSRSLVPLVNLVNETSAQTIASTYSNFATIAVGIPTWETLDALAYALQGMGIGCDEIGDPSWTNEKFLCFADDTHLVPEALPGAPPHAAPVAPLPDTSTNLGNDLYVTSTYVQDKANIALDIKEMREALSEGSIDLARLVYQQGRNSQVYDENGKFKSLRTLQGFSTQETIEMTDDPVFNIYMYALRDGSETLFTQETRTYADVFVEKSFQGLSTIPAEAAVALNVWMHVAHLLYKTLKNCKEKKIRDEEGVHPIDVAAAYWIGDDQVAGDGTRGHLLYALAESMGDHFNMDGAGQSRTNVNMMGLFNDAKNEINLPGACGESPVSFNRLQRITNRMISTMSVPLIQGLIHFLRANDQERVTMYALAVVPMMVGCSPSTYAYLKDKLLDGNYNVVEVEEVVAAVRSTLPCLGLTCDDIGVHNAETTSDAPACTDPDVLTDLAGYRPASDVRSMALFDLDLRELDILMEMRAYSAAQDLYTFGKRVAGNNGGSLSLSQMASSSSRSIVPEFDTFKQYYDSESYADDMIQSVLRLEGSWTDAQRRKIVQKASQVNVLFWGALQAFYESVSDCKATAAMRAAGASDNWDKGVALMIGFLEGPEKNGTNEGYMYHELGQEYCQAFGVCHNGTNNALVNDELASLFYAGRGAVLASSCGALGKAANEISELMLVPIVQGALLSAIQLSNSDDADGLHRAEGYVFSRALLPLVDRASRKAASDIDKHLGLPGPTSTRDTAKDVFEAFAKVYPEMGVDCELVGEASKNNACTGVVSRASRIGIIVGSVVGVLLCCCLGVFLMKRERKKLPENNPRFVKSPNGELNHSMDLLEKAFSSNNGPRTPQTAESIPLAEDMYNDAEPADDDDDFDEAQALKSKMDTTDIQII